MKKIILPIFIITFIIGCTTSYQLISRGEIFKNLTQVTFGDDYNYYPALSDSGDMILFSSLRDGDFNIFLKKDITAKSEIKKTSHPSSDIHPSFSPDGKRFAFSSNRNGNYDIYIMSTDGGYAKTQITSTNDDELYPDWSSDGKNIVFCQYSKYDLQWYIWIKNTINGQLTQICQGLTPKYSKDGKSIYYKKSDNDGYFQLWKININGETDTQLTSGSDWGIASFQISPDERRIIYSTNKSSSFDETLADDGNDLWAVSLSSGDLIQVTTHKGSDYTPFWAGDDYIYFASDRMGDVNIWRFKSNF